MRVELAKLHNQLKATMVYVTHDQTEAMTMADDIVVIDNGIVSQKGSPLDLYNKPRNMFVAGFIGSPSMNFFNGDLKNGKFLSEECEFSGLGKDSFNNVVLGVRPEDMEIVSDSIVFTRPQVSIRLRSKIRKTIFAFAITSCFRL